jgi:hypothetical protein
LAYPDKITGFGISASISGDYCIVGADNQDGSGLAFIYFIGPLPGDINADGEVTLADAVICLKILTETPIGESFTAAADADGNKQIGLADAVFVLNMLAE